MLWFGSGWGRQTLTVNYLAILGVGLQASGVSKLIIASFLMFGVQTVSLHVVVLYIVLRLTSLNLESHVSAGTKGVATLGIGLPALCYVIFRSCPLFTRNIVWASRCSASAYQCRVVWRPDARELVNVVEINVSTFGAFFTAPVLVISHPLNFALFVAFGQCPNSRHHDARLLVASIVSCGISWVG
jgi:hypothetical protein